MLCQELLEKVFLYLIESDSEYSQSSQNKYMYSDLRLVCKDWSKIVCADILWKPRIHFACQNNYFDAIKLYGKKLYESKLDIVDQNWYTKYKLQVEIINCNTGQYLYNVIGNIIAEDLNDTDTRFGIKNECNVINSTIIKTDKLKNSLKNIRIRLILYFSNKFAVLFDRTDSIGISYRQSGGYFKLPINTFFCSTKKIQYVKNNYKAYVCFDLIKNENSYEFHKSTSMIDKYLSSLAFILECNNLNAQNFFQNLNWMV